MSMRARIGLLVEAQGARRAASEVDGVARSVGRMGERSERSGRQMSGARRQADLFQRGLHNTARAAKYGALAVAGLGTVIGRSAIGEYREAAKAARQTNAVIESTGGVANVTADHVAALSGKLSLQAGIDDEAIQQGANLLLTFKNIRNEVGKGNDVFDQANQAALDLSAAGFGSLEGTAKQMGKALNDPVKGITALGRAGVTFTQDQKDTIASLVEQNKTLEAQKIILGEVNSQVAGSAKAQADPIDRAKVAWQNLMETIGTGMAPVIEKVAVAVATFVGGMQDGTGAGGKFVDVLKGYVLPALKWVASAAINAGKWLIQAFKNVRAWVVANWPRIREVLASIAKPILAFVIPAAKLLWSILRNVFSWVVANWPQIRDVLKTLAWPITNVVIPAIETILTTAGKVFDYINDNWPTIRGILKTLAWPITNVVIPAFEILKDILEWVVDKIQWVLDKVGDVVGAVGDVAGAVGDVGGGIGDGISAVAGLVGGATGGTITRGGPLWVGEEGPEIVDLPGGAKITPNYALNDRLDGGGLTVGGVVELHLHSHLGEREVAHSVRRVALKDLLATSPA